MNGSNPHFPGCSGGGKNRESVYLYPGDFHFATEPTMIHTVLGSCVSVVLFDRVNHYGSMCHAVLDADPYQQEITDCSKYVDCVIDEMFSNFAEHGTVIENLVTKIFGGAQIFVKGKGSLQTSQPGVRNMLMAKKKLQEYNCPIEAEDCGGFEGRKIYFCSHTGEVFLKRIKRPHDIKQLFSMLDVK